jgi:LysM repeat protein
VQAGDTGCAIAQKLGVPLAALAEANGTTVNGLAALQIGQSLKVPTTRGPAGC